MKITAPRLKLSAIATACTLAFASTAQAQSSGTVLVDATSLLSTDVSQSLNAFGFELTLLTAQHTAANLSAGALASTLTASFVTSPDAAITLNGNSIAAAVTANQASNSADLSLLGSGTNPFAIAAANSQLRGPGTSNATVAGPTIEARSVDSQFAPVTISNNSVSASVELNTANTNVSGTPTRAFNSSEPVSSALANAGTLINATANIAVVNAQTASNASGNSGSGAIISQGTVIASATGAPNGAGNALSEAVTVSNNAIAASFASNTATTMFASNPGAAAFTGGVIVANVQTDIESGAQPGSLSEAAQPLASAQVRDTTVTADVRQPGGAGNVLGAAVTLSGNQISATSSGNKAGELGENGRVLAGNALVIDSASSVSSTREASSISVNSLQQSSGTQYVSSIDAANISAAADSIGDGGSLTLRDNRLLASASGNLAGNLASVTASSIDTNLRVSNEQSTLQTLVKSEVSGSSVTAGVQSATLASSGAVTLSGNLLSAAADANTAANTLVQRANSITGRADSDNLQTISDATIRAEMAGAGVEAKVSAAGVDSMTIGNSRNSLTAIAGGNTFTGSTSLQAEQIGTAQAGFTNLNTSTQNASGMQLSASITAGVVTNVTGDVANSRLSVTDNSVASAAVGNRSSQLADIVATSLSNQQTSVESNQSASADISATTNAANSLIVSGASAVSGASLTASGNSAQALAIGNTSLNTLVVSATSVSGSGGSFNVNSTQYGQGGVSALSTAKQEIIALGTIDSSSITLSNNSISAAALGQSVSNRLQINASGLTGATAGISNIQDRSGGDVTASVAAAEGPLLGVNTGSASSTPITISGNKAEASAMQNDAINVLQASAASLVSQTGSPALAVDNRQSSIGGANASVSSGLVGLQASSLSSGNAVVSDNRMAASAGVNTATNAVIVDATSALNAIGSVNSNQTASGAVDASVGGVSPTYLGVIAPLNEGVALNALNATVSGNMMMAQGTANTATNILNAVSANPIGNAGAIAPVATYAVNNVQSSSGAISTRVTNAQVGIAGASVDGSALTVSGNTVAALSTANTASNQLSVSATPGPSMQASASLSNTQISSSAVSAQVSGVSVVATGAAPTQAGASRTATLSGNAIAAQATGNTAVNQIIGR